MDVKGRKALVFGGAGLVGRAVCKELIESGISSLVVCSRFKEEAEEFASELRSRYNADVDVEWGDIFLRYNMRELPRDEIMRDARLRRIFLSDIVEPLNRDILTESAVFQILMKHKPDIIIDSINTASIIAYQNVFGEMRKVLSKIGGDPGELAFSAEKLVGTLYIPQLIRHVQIMLQSMMEANTRFYLKIGTCGTGGMGLNIPYTHSEDRPSQMLLAKSAIAGAHSLLLFLMARTPGGPIIKELKPAAAIAWKKVAYGTIKRQGSPILLEDVSLEDAVSLSGYISKAFRGEIKYLMKEGVPMALEAPYIDTGENGFFSLGEFEAITDEGQMEFITPEEIAKCVTWEIQGLNTGHDIVAALDNSVLGPTYRAGYMRHGAIRELKRLVEATGVDSVAFEILGPPRLSKLLYEAYLLKKEYGTFDAVLAMRPEEISRHLETVILSDPLLRSRIISIGIPILLSSGLKLLRGSRMAVPPDVPGQPDAKFEVDDARIDKWANDGWVDLRPKNILKWQTRFRYIKAYVDGIPKDDTSSSLVKGVHYWKDDEGKWPISISKLASWIFINEDRGERMKW